MICQHTSFDLERDASTTVPDIYDSDLLDLDTDIYDTYLLDPEN